MNLVYPRKKFLAILLVMTITFSTFLLSLGTPLMVGAAGGGEISDLEGINQNPSVNFLVSQSENGKIEISNDSTSGGFSSKGIKNTSYLITPIKYSGDFSVEAKLKVVKRTITGTGGVVGIGAFSGTGEQDAFVSAVARGDNSARSYYKKDDGGFGGGSPNLSSSTEIGQDIDLKLERQGGNYVVTINGESKALSGLNNETNNGMYLGFVISGATAEVDKFVIKADGDVIYDLFQPVFPRPIVTVIADGENVNVEWTEVAGAISYTVEYRQLGASEWTRSIEGTKKLNQTVSGLTSMIPYEFRVKVNGGSSDTLYSTNVMTIPGFSWSSVECPSITEIHYSDDGKGIIVDFNMQMGALGATVTEVLMLKDDEVIKTQSVRESISVLGTLNNSVEFVPDESGNYTFIIKASRDGEDYIKESKSYDFKFELPVQKPAVKVTAIETGSVKLDWKPVKEAERYSIGYKKASDELWSIATQSTTGSSYTIKNLEVGTVYDFKVTAFKDKKSASSIISCKVKDVVGEVVDWNTIIFGQSISRDRNNIEIDNINDTVTIVAGEEDGKVAGGKVTGSHDGISYYYTEIDSSKNFEVSANIKVNFFAKEKPDNQEAFGIMARDAIGTHLDSSVFASNMVMVGGYRGAIQSVFRNGVEDSTGAGAVMEDVYKFGDRPANGGIVTYKMILKKTNTGYHVSVDDGIEKIYYRPKQLEVLNPGKVYIGFFAARVASITVSDISIKTSNVMTDPPGIPEPPKPIEASLDVISSDASSSSKYDLKLISNVRGQIEINQDENQIYKGPIEKDKTLIRQTELVSGDNIFKILYTPDPTENITNRDSIELTYIVTLRNYEGAGDVIYVSPDGKPDSDGTKDDPIDIYSAIRFIGDEQIIYVRGGVYELMAPIVIERGNDGTNKRPKCIFACPGDDRPVLNFSGLSNGDGFTIIGDHWHIYGIDISNAPLKGLVINGNYNLIELVNTYSNGDTGLQISRFPGDTRNKWPSHNLILHCTSYDNIDSSQNNADGFAAKLTCGQGNIFRGCIAHNNCDDGWDLYSKLETGAIGTVTVENCIAYGNGTLSNGIKTNGDGNGFKMGGEGLAIKHVLRNSLAFDNASTGITSNSNPALIVENCTSVDNGKANFDFSYYNNVTPNFIAKNNISFRTIPGAKDNVPKELISVNNYFYNGYISANIDGKKVLGSDFESLDRPIPIGRDKEGRINIDGFMVITQSSLLEGGAKLEDYSNITEPEEPEEESGEPEEESGEPEEESGEPEEESEDTSPIEFPNLEEQSCNNIEDELPKTGQGMNIYIYLSGMLFILLGMLLNEK